MIVHDDDKIHQLSPSPQLSFFIFLFVIIANNYDIQNFWNFIKTNDIFFSNFPTFAEKKKTRTNPPSHASVAIITEQDKIDTPRYK